MIFKKRPEQYGTTINNTTEESMDYTEQDQPEECSTYQTEDTEVVETAAPRPVPGSSLNKKQVPPPVPSGKPVSTGPGRPKQQGAESDDPKYGLSAKIDRHLSSRIKFYAYIKGKTLAQLIEEWIVLYCPELPDNIR